MFALVDCNSFYASCERVFKPALKEKPVVVLSNNDGCVIALSNEAKKIGIKMGDPAFKYKEIFETQKVATFSPNFPLYGDLSHRVFQILSLYSPDIEQYSIDESFLYFKETDRLDEIGEDICKKILKCVGVPVRVGFGQTKTLAKLANHLAKKSGKGVFNLAYFNLNNVLKTIPVEDIWGIGRKYSELLKKNRVDTAYKFREMCPKWVQKHLTVVGRRIQLELCGTPCLSLEEVAESRKSILSSRSFGEKLTELKELEGAISSNIMTACEKLRSYKMAAREMVVYICTSRFHEDYYSRSLSITFQESTNSTLEMIQHATQGLSKIFIPGKRYAKSGALLLNLVPEASVQTCLFPTNQRRFDSKLMATLDNINKKWGRHMVSPAISMGHTPWRMKQGFRSPNYTTSWHELPIGKCV